jgi:hypothetical protein
MAAARPPASLEHVFEVGAKRLSYLAWLARIVQPKNDAKRSLADQILAGIPQILGERGVEITLTKWSWVVVIE